PSVRKKGKLTHAFRTLRGVHRAWSGRGAVARSVLRSLQKAAPRLSFYTTKKARERTPGEPPSKGGPQVRMHGFREANSCGSMVAGAMRSATRHCRASQSRPTHISDRTMAIETGHEDLGWRHRRGLVLVPARSCAGRGELLATERQQAAQGATAGRAASV